VCVSNVIQKFEVRKIFLNVFFLLSAPRLHLFDQKYSKIVIL